MLSIWREANLWPEARPSLPSRGAQSEAGPTFTSDTARSKAPRHQARLALVLMTATTTVTPGSSWRVVASAKDLNPLSVSDFRCTTDSLAPTGAAIRPR